MKINRGLIDPWFKYDPLSILGSKKKHDLQRIAKIAKLSAENRKLIENTNSNNSTCPTVSIATPKYHIRTAVHSTQPTASTATQPQSPVISKQANDSNSPDVLTPCFPAFKPKRSKIEEHSA